MGQRGPATPGSHPKLEGGRASPSLVLGLRGPLTAAWVRTAGCFVTAVQETTATLNWRSVACAQALALAFPGLSSAGGCGRSVEEARAGDIAGRAGRPEGAWAPGSRQALSRDPGLAA